MPDVGNHVTLAADGLSILVVDDGGGDSFTAYRVIDPATIPKINATPLSADGVVGQPFSYSVTATNTSLFSADGLPAGLVINPISGEIIGTPTVGGAFSVTIGAMSSAGVSDFETLALTIAIPTPVGTNVVVQPEVPEGLGDVTVSFGEVTDAGTTTVTVIDPADAPPLPVPGSLSVAGVIYDVQTTASYQGLITLCFSYAGVDFGTDAPRLFHYENNTWVDITTSVDPATQTICGATTSLSPFAVFASPVVRSGFYAPLNPITGVVNVVKARSTVPLKFNVSIDGVNQTTTAGLTLTTQQIACDTDAPLDEVEAAPTTGGSTLRYDAQAGYFIANWSVPNTRGACYMVRMTTQRDGLALTAKFAVK